MVPKRDKLDSFVQAQMALIESEKNDIASSKTMESYWLKRAQKYGQKSNVNPKRVGLKINENSLLEKMSPKKRDSKHDGKQ